MVAEFDEEQQETRTNQPHSKSDEHRDGVRCGLFARHHEQYGKDDQDECANALAFQFRIDKHKFLGDNGQQESQHQRRKEQRCAELARQKQSHGYRDHQQIDRKRPSLREEETVEAEQPHIILGSTEGETHHQNKENGSQGQSRAHPYRRLLSIRAHHQDGRERSERHSKPSKPSRGIIGLCALSGLTSIDDQGAGKHHLSQTEKRTCGNSRPYYNTGRC